MNTGTQRLSLAIAGIVITLSAINAHASDTETYETQTVVPGHVVGVSHGSSLLELPGGGLMACWFSGSAEGAPDVRILCSRRSALDGNWDNPQVVVDRGETATNNWISNRKVGNSSLMTDSDGNIFMFYSGVPFGGWVNSQIQYKVSRDGGRTWSSGMRHSDFFGTGQMVRNSAIQLSDCRYAVPFYNELLGSSFVDILNVAKGEILKQESLSIPGSKQIQPSIVEQNGKLVAYMRNPENGYLKTAVFDFGTQKWSEPQSLSIFNPNSPVAAVTMEDGRVLLVYNDKTRNVLSLAVSESNRDPLHFRKVLDLDAPTDGDEVRYPAFIRAKDGSFHLSYTCANRTGIRYKTFSRQWIERRIAEAMANPDAVTYGPVQKPASR